MASKWKTVFERAERKAWQIAQEDANFAAEKDLPVPLHDLAVRHRIETITFEPLLSTAGLARSGEGFSLCLNTDGPEIKYAAGTSFDLSSFDSRTLGIPVRFAVAHEIAHAIFAKAVPQNAQPDLLDLSEKSLETACNEIARALLVPKRRLLRELGDRHFDAPHMRSIIRLFGVSAEVFLRRLRHDDLKTEFPRSSGLIGYADKDDGGTPRFVEAFASGNFVTERFVNVLPQRRLEGASIENLEIDPNVREWLKEKEFGPVTLNTPYRPGATIKCVFSMAEIRSSPQRILVAIAVIGPPEAAAG